MNRAHLRKREERKAVEELREREKKKHSENHKIYKTQGKLLMKNCICFLCLLFLINYVS